MITRVLRSLRDAAWHPVDEQLVAFIDAELGSRESGRVRRHLARCWACRGRERRLRATIDAFMDAYAAHEVDADEEALLPHPVRLPHAARAALRARTPALACVSSAARFMREALRARTPALLARVRAAARTVFIGVRVRQCAPSALSRQPPAARATLSQAAQHQRTPALFALSALAARAGAGARTAAARAAVHLRIEPSTFVHLGAACVTAAVIVLLTTGVPLSARQVVRHADRAERGVLATMAAPVVYQRLEIAVRRLPGGATTGGTFTLWTDVERRRHHGDAVSDGAAPDAGSGGAGARVSAAATPDIRASSAASRRPAHRAARVEKVHDAPDASDASAASAETGGASEADDALAELLAMFARHGMTAAWPVSLRSYEQMRAAADDAAEERVVSERAPDGERLLTIETTASQAGTVDTHRASIDTRLVVRERDWHPIEQRLTVREGSETTEFVVREQEFEVMSLATLPVAFFDAPPLPEPARAMPDATTAEVEARPMPPAASDLVSAEVQAIFALHRVGLTAEDDIAVERRDSIVEVTGLAASAARRTQLIDAIARIKHVHARIRTADEVLSELTADRGTDRASRALRGRSASAGRLVEEISPAAPVALRMDEAVIDATRVPGQALAAGGSTSRASGGAPTTSSVSGGTPGMARDALAGANADGRLLDRRADEASMRRAREAVRQSLALLERAWALRRLAEWARRTSATTVTTNTRELIELMVREHAEAASKALAALDTTVTPSLQMLPSLHAPPSLQAPRDGTRANAEGALPSTDAGAAGTAGNRAWVDVATDFFGVAAEIDRDTRRLFTASSTPPTSTEAAEEARRLRDGLDRAAQWLLALRQPQPHPQLPLPPQP